MLSVAATVDHCELCRGDQGDSDAQRARRAEEHLPMHQERGNAARAAAEKYEEKMRGAYRSRKYLIRMLRRLRNLHEAHGRKCSCGVKDRRSLDILESGWVREQISSLKLREMQDRAADPYWDDERELETYVSAQRTKNQRLKDAG